MRFLGERRGFTLVLGWWPRCYAGRFSFDNKGRFGNGSRWFSGWHRFPSEGDL